MKKLFNKCFYSAVVGGLVFYILYFSVNSFFSQHRFTKIGEHDWGKWTVGNYVEEHIKHDEDFTIVPYGYVLKLTTATIPAYIRMERVCVCGETETVSGDLK